MTEPTPNDAQRRLIDTTEGVLCVDAGPGTGKTFAITRRYAAIVEQPGVDPEDVLLVTFTESAATEMKERIVDHSAYSLRQLADASIQTFHAHCLELLTERGHRAPTHLGLDERITDRTRIVEDDVVRAELFAEFFDAFRDDHPEYADFYRVLDGPGDLQALLSEFAAKGIIPTTDGWYRDGEDALEGDFEAFQAAFEAANQPRNDGRKQSTLRQKLNAYGRDKTYLPDAPSKATIRGDGTKRVPDATARRAFDADRTDLQSFVHDVYLSYLAFALSRNVLTFGLLQVFAFVLLCEDATVREDVGFEYVVVDEFQDTSEIQFKLALLLADTDNLCAVGDWKQSIFAFQYADVENITRFSERLRRFGDALTADADRLAFDPHATDVTHLELTENYRSTQTLIDFSESALVAPATDGEDVDASVAEDVTGLDSNAPFDETRLEGLAHEDEHAAVLTAVQEIVGNSDYPVEDENGDPRPPEYGDVAVFTRTRDYGRELLSLAGEYDLPMAYDGGVELFRTDQAKLLLAWLRILTSDADRGWAVVLERAGYTLDEVDHVLHTGDYPDAMVAFRDALADLETVGAVGRRVFDRYGFTGEYADVILDTVQSVHDDSNRTRGDLVRFIECAISEGTTHEVTTGAGTDAVTVQTIHAAKGLEYPIVVLANMNDGAFPPSVRDDAVITYDDTVGLRQRKVYSEVGAHPHVYHDWRHDVLRHCLGTDHDEERRLCYVAITRAEHHVLLTAGEEPNAFFDALPVDERPIDPDVQPVDREDTVQATLPFGIVPPDGPNGETPHTLMDDAVFAGEGCEREPAESLAAIDAGGRAFGSRVHDFAEAYATGGVGKRAGDETTEERADECRIADFLDALEGELHVETPVTLPLDVDGETVVVSGVVDLVHETADAVEIVDYKTDASRHAETEYRIQLSIYYHVLAETFPEKPVSAELFYTGLDEHVEVEPLSRAELADVVRSRR